LNPNADIRPQLEQWQADFDAHLRALLQKDSAAPDLLINAMHYSALAGGKRMRPLLVFASARALGEAPRDMLGVAAAVELIHTYSLIHDDLPAMDDDDLRRGRASCHRAFDEATAILAGDALQALAFEILAGCSALSEKPAAQVRIIGDIAHACGAAGMAGGQVLDLAAIGRQISYAELETMHRLKTGALIRVSATAPSLFAGSAPELTARLDRYGECVGLAFQIHDDVLDVTASSQQTGKPSQADAARNKPAFPSLIGLDASRERARQLQHQAVAELTGFPGDTSVLEWLAAYAIQRDS
jgi:farnesyl diphosphate synthase